MPKLAPHVLPSYRRQNQPGQAVVTLNGKDVLLGRHTSPESREAYQRATEQWLAAGRQLPRAEVPLTVVELLAAFWRHCQAYYRRPDGTPTSEADLYRLAMTPLRETYGRTAAADFGPLALRVVRDNMVARGWARTNVNRMVGQVKAVFRWGVEGELIPASVHQALSAVGGLRKGRTAATEPEPVRPVADALVDAGLPHVSPRVAAMIGLQPLTGMRPGGRAVRRGRLVGGGAAAGPVRDAGLRRHPSDERGVYARGRAAAAERAENGGPVVAELRWLYEQAKRAADALGNQLDFLEAMGEFLSRVGVATPG